MNVKTEWFHCWICETSGKTLVPILRLKRNQFLDEYISTLKSRRKEKVEKEYVRPDLPAKFKTLSEDTGSHYRNMALNYLRERGFGMEHVLRYKLGYCEEGPYANRIVIPSFDENGFLNFFTSRLFRGQGISYKHEEFSKDIIFNDCMVDWNMPITLTEGPFDYMRIGTNAVPLQTSSLSEESLLFERIVLAGVPVYCALDGDAFRKQLRLLESLVSYGVECYHVDLKGSKDAAEMTEEQYRECEAKAKRVSSKFDILRLKANQCA